MDKNFEGRYRQLVRGHIENFGRKETVAPNAGRIGCQVNIQLPPESIAALKAIGKRARQDVPAAPLRIADGLRNLDVLQSELNIGTEALNG